MRQKPDQPSKASGVQVFELTMDNPEDQDELNRRLRKPGNLSRPSRRRMGKPPRNPPDGNEPA